ncbi:MULTISPECIES: LapA family protein [Mycobacterium]|uniref:LapA family protein n=1 Tax=Mycobacterium colombiense TaxID=339268 RepID=A0A329LRN7_9MYCO|nr:MULTISPECIES: LapA family protein [Mycobacterium]MDM4142859.1 LapA family protein [Mycobacterium sp. FLAC0960]RAV07407.1 LapA family protein [Mycobacterium colombiense]
MRHRPVDHDRTADPRMGGAGQTPGLLVVAAAALAFVVCVANFALGQVGAGVAAAIVAMLAFGAGLSWLAMDRRRIRDAERHWTISHPAH